MTSQPHNPERRWQPPIKCLHAATTAANTGATSTCICLLMMSTMGMILSRKTPQKTDGLDACRYLQRCKRFIRMQHDVSRLGPTSAASDGMIVSPSGSTGGIGSSWCAAP